MPEEMRISRALLADNWVVYAMSSKQREHPKSWSFETDGPRVVKAVATFRARHNLSARPVIALGVSAGGALALKLPQLMAVDAVVSQIMALPATELKSRDSSPFPPTLFIHMSRDGQGPITTTSHVAACVAELTRRGVKASDVLASPLPITSTFFSDRIEYCPEELSLGVRSALSKGGILDDADMLIDDPRVSRKWCDVLLADTEVATRLPGIEQGVPDALTADLSPVGEVLNTAYAQHEITADHMQPTLEWINALLP